MNFTTKLKDYSTITLKQSYHYSNIKTHFFHLAFNRLNNTQLSKESCNKELNTIKIIARNNSRKDYNSKNKT